MYSDNTLTGSHVLEKKTIIQSSAMACRSCSMILDKVIDGNQTMADGILRYAGTSPFIDWKDLGNGSILLYGPVVIFLETFARFLKLKPVAVNEVGLVFGSKHKNGSYDGVLGLVQQKKADIFGSPSVANLDRLIDFDYYGQVEQQEIRLLTRKPESFIDPWGFVRAFQPSVWFYLFATILVFSICTSILDWLDTQISTDDPGRRSRGVFSFIWIWSSRLFPQPDVVPGHQWIRWCAVAFMLPTSLLLVNALEADLKGSLLFKKDVDYVNSYEDILRFKNMKMIVEEGSLLVTMFTRSQHPFMKKLTAHLVRRGGFFSATRGFQQSLDEISMGKAVLVGSTEMAMGPIVRLIRTSGTCPKIKVSDGHITLLSGSLPIGRHVPYEIREKIHNVRLRILESFVYRQNVIWWLEPYFRCNAKVRDETLEALAVTNLEGTFYLLLIGFASSVLGFIYEWIVFRQSCFPSRDRHIRLAHSTKFY